MQLIKSKYHKDAYKIKERPEHIIPNTATPTDNPNYDLEMKYIAFDRNELFENTMYLDWDKFIRITNLIK